MTDEQIVIIVAETIERSMFAPHEFPLSLELHAKYMATARDVVAELKFARQKLVIHDVAAPEARMNPGLTVEEARQTWCPFAKAVFQDTDRHRDNNCIAANCMAWRWSDPALTNEPAHVRRPMADHRKGFCGLASPINTIIDWHTS